MENNETQTPSTPSTRELLDQIVDQIADAGADLNKTDELVGRTHLDFDNDLEGTTDDAQERLSREQVHGIRNGARAALRELSRLKDVLDDIESQLKDIHELAQERLDA